MSGVQSYWPTHNHRRIHTIYTSPELPTKPLHAIRPWKEKKLPTSSCCESNRLAINFKKDSKMSLNCSSFQFSSQLLHNSSWKSLLVAIADKKIPVGGWGENQSIDGITLHSGRRRKVCILAAHPHTFTSPPPSNASFYFLFNTHLKTAPF